MTSSSDPAGSAGLEVAFTPGPWANEGEDCASDRIPFIEVVAGAIGAPSFKPIANVQATFDGADEWAITPEDEANARLIAAAPDLYRELSAALEDLWAERHAFQDRVSFESDFASGFAALSRAGKSS